MTDTDREGQAAICRHCGGTALIPLGRRVDHPRRWLRWVAMVTHISICERCQAVYEAVERRRLVAP